MMIINRQKKTADAYQDDIEKNGIWILSVQTSEMDVGIEPSKR